MSGNCNLRCHSCQCSCNKAGDHTTCMNCMQCKSSDRHERK